MKPIAKRIATVLATLLPAALPAALTAQPAYTLDECVELALQNNVRMKNAANELADAEHQRRAAFTRYFPSVSATGVGFLASRPLLALEAAPGVGMEMMKNGLAGGVMASLPLFTGGQIVNGNRLAEVNVEKYRLQGRQAENEVRLTTEQYFWQIVLLKEKRKTLQAVAARLATMAADVEAAVEAGVTDRNDLLQVRLRQNDTRSAGISVDNALALSRRLLAQYIGRDTAQVDVAFSVTDSLPPAPGTLYRQPETALPLTPEYGLLQAKVRAERTQHRIAVGKNLPTVAIGGGYLYDNLLSHNRTYWAGFATVTIPLSGWWEGSHSVRRSRLAVQTAENNLRDGCERLTINMQNAWNNVTDAYRQVRIAIESIGQATENLRLQTDRYHAGTTTMSDWLEAQALFQQSRDKYVEACAQYEVKKREYLQATGR